MANKADIQIKCFQEILLNRWKHSRKVETTRELEEVRKATFDVVKEEYEILKKYNCVLRQNDEPNLAMIEVL